jgi:hypothetical protein
VCSSWPSWPSCAQVSGEPVPFLVVSQPHVPGVCHHRLLTCLRMECSMITIDMERSILRLQPRIADYGAQDS